VRWTGFFLSLSPYILLIFVFLFFSKFAGGQSGRHRRSVASFCGKFVVVVVVVVFWDWNIRLLLLNGICW
jgi:Fe2+ transport system protein B